MGESAPKHGAASATKKKDTSISATTNSFLNSVGVGKAYSTIESGINNLQIKKKNWSEESVKKQKAYDKAHPKK